MIKKRSWAGQLSVRIKNWSILRTVIKTHHLSSQNQSGFKPVKGSPIQFATLAKAIPCYSGEAGMLDWADPNQSIAHYIIGPKVWAFTRVVNG